MKIVLPAQLQDIISLIKKANPLYVTYTVIILWIFWIWICFLPTSTPLVSIDLNSRMNNFCGVYNEKIFQREYICQQYNNYKQNTGDVIIE